MPSSRRSAALEGSPASQARVRARLRAAAVALLLAAPACELPGADRPSPFFAAFALYGTWEWSHTVDEPGVHRVERELWKWIPASTPGVVHGQYLREVTATSDGLPFACNQDQQYTQRAWFEVEARAVTVTDDASLTLVRKKPRSSVKIEIVEKAYRTEPSPCDHGFRKLGRYLVTARGDRAVLSFPEGRQTLHRTSAAGGPLEVPWERHPPTLAGPWRWSTQSLDEQGLWRTEDERWELALTQSGPGGFDLGMGAAPEHAKIFDAVVTRRVRITSPDGSLIPCAGAGSYGFEDRYILDAKRRGALMALQETGVSAGEHPCLRTRTERTLDTATLERLGDFLVLEWRGKRRQVLHRPHPSAAGAPIR